MGDIDMATMRERWEKARAASGYSQMAYWGTDSGRQLMDAFDTLTAENATQAASLARLTEAGEELLAQNAALRTSLGEVMGWINNWSPDFIHDEEWPEAEARATAVLAKAAS